MCLRCDASHCTSTALEVELVGGFHCPQVGFENAVWVCFHTATREVSHAFVCDRLDLGHLTMDMRSARDHSFHIEKASCYFVFRLQGI